MADSSGLRLLPSEWDGVRQCASRQVTARSGEGVVPGALGSNTVTLTNYVGLGCIPVSPAERPTCGWVTRMTN